MAKNSKLFLIPILFSFTTCTRYIHGFEYIVKNQHINPEAEILKSKCKFKTELTQERYLKLLEAGDPPSKYSQIYFVVTDENIKLNYALKYVFVKNELGSTYKVYAFTTKPSESSLTSEPDFQNMYESVSTKVIKECFKLEIEAPKLILREMK